MLTAVVLGAGSSRRFGDDKRKALLPDGQKVIVQTIRRISEVIDDILVVLRFGDRDFAATLDEEISDERVRFFLAPDSAKGMAHSLGNAVHELRDCDGVMVFLADMPFVSRKTIETLRDAFRDRINEHPIVLPTLNGTPGHPVTFHRSYFEEIAGLQGDRGARPVIDAHQDQLVAVSVRDEGVLKDIDRPEDIQVR